MATITLKGSTIHTNGELPSLQDHAPDFRLVATDLGLRTLGDYAGRMVLLNIFPSVDTPVCALSTRKFNDHAQTHPQQAFLMISADLPFAHQRFCAQAGLDNVIPLSMMRDRDFARDYGVLIVDGPLAGLAARAVVVLGPDGRVRYRELVPEIGQEPDYGRAIGALGG
jgi:thiol peroxidase